MNTILDNLILPYGKDFKIGTTTLKYDKDFGSYFGTLKPEPYNTGKNEFKPKFRSIYLSSEMYKGTNKSFFYITSHIHGEMRLYRHSTWFETDVANIFASGKTLKAAITKFNYNIKHKIYNKAR